MILGEEYVNRGEQQIVDQSQFMIADTQDYTQFSFLSEDVLPDGLTLLQINRMKGIDEVNKKYCIEVLDTYIETLTRRNLHAEW